MIFFISKLTELGYLHLSGNNLSGTILNNIENLTKLEYLYLSGKIFSNLCSISSLSFSLQ